MKLLVAMVVGLFVTTGLYAKKGALIDWPGPKPQVAKSWKSLGPGKYQFTLDSSKKVSAADVKTSLEKRMKSFKVKVTPQGSNVTVAYTGAEEEFLKKVAKVKIRKSSGGSVTIAETRADGGIRADSANRALRDGEVRATVLSVSGGVAQVMPADISPLAKQKGISKRPTKIKASGVQKGKTIYFQPSGKEGTVWKVQGLSNK